MIDKIFGRKIGMTQVFDDNGVLIPVTIIQAGPCYVVQKKSGEVDGYNAVQLGYGELKKKHANKPIKGHLKRHGCSRLPSKIKEVRVKDATDIDYKKMITVDIFKSGDKVDISGITKGRGFAGVMKRYNMRGAPATRGSHRMFRHVGSLGGGSSNMTRVLRGKRLPGRMGMDKCTTLNLEVIEVLSESNHLLVKGAVPGARNGSVHIRKTNR